MGPIRDGKDFLVENLDMSRYVTSIAAALTVTVIGATVSGIIGLANWLLKLVGVDILYPWLVAIGVLICIFLLWGVVFFLSRTHLKNLSQRIPEDSAPTPPTPSITPGSAASTLNASESIIYAGDTGQICHMEGIYFELINPENTILLRPGETFPPAIGKYGFLRPTTWLLREYPYNPSSHEDSDLKND